MSTPLNVLLAEDSEDDAFLLVRELRRNGYEPTWERVQDAGSMQAALRRGGWDVVVSDSAMPQFSASAALDLLKESGSDAPFVIVSGTIGEEAAVAAMRAGASDFVLKGKIARLGPVVERELREGKVRAARRQAEADLRASEARHRVLFERSPLPMWVYDVETLAFLAVNEAAVRHYGYTREEFATMSPVNLRPPEDRRPAGVARPIGEEGAGQHHVKKDGSKILVEARTSDFDFEGRRARVVSIVDVTERHRLEQELRQSQKMDAIGKLAGGIAHDFNNILSVILSYGEILLGDLKAGDPVRDDIEEIHKAGKRAADLTRQLLMFSRQQVIEPRILDLNEVLGGMDKMLQRILGADVDLVTIPAPGLRRVRADPGSVEQVIMNLAVNARDAMPTGGMLTMETANVVLDDGYAREHAGSRAGPHVMLAVTDTGTGMDKATQGRIFEPFFTTKETGKGTGLGLSTVFGIVRQSGGSVWVYSEPGRGTTFKVYLPSVLDGADEEAPAAPAPRTLRGTETILLVEDDDQVRAVAGEILRNGGYEVLEARDAGEALALSETFADVIHLVIADVIMPRMGGPELARRLVRVRPDMRVLCTSGYTDDSIVRHGFLEAQVAYLQKPITPVALTTKVREVLDATAAAITQSPPRRGR